jgi:3-oxoacyl-[acyl-carrier protein] reductase
MSGFERAIVTGSSSGIGAAIARRLLADGWYVEGWDRAPACIANPQFVARQIDLCDPGALRTAADVACKAGPPQALVHAAGVLRTGALGSLSAQDAQPMWQLHVQAATLLAESVLPAMCAVGHGRVVLIGSRVWRGLAGRSQYAASKAALVSLARSWASEVVAQGVTVNVISPAATDTPMLVDPLRAGVAPRLPPMGRLIQPDEVAALAAFLLSAQAVAITGQDIAVCGGASLPR